jgi:hypothetical protein
MTNLFITVILILTIAVIFTWIQAFDFQKKQGDKKCNLTNFDINKIHIIKRTPEYQNMINKLIDEKRFIFTDDELKMLKNKFQIYNITENDIQNITKIIMSNCKNKLNETFELSPEELEEVKYNILNNTEYNTILKNLETDVMSFNDLDCDNTKFLKCNNQQNYYYDLFGNNIISNTKQYYVNYLSTINDKDEKYCVPVETVPVKKPKGYNVNQLPLTDKPAFNNPFNIQPLDEDYTDFIIPIQYQNDIEQTDLYNIDNSRIINPYTIY